MYGYTGKILRVNLTNKQVTTINTEDYKEWSGGHGLGTALFFDICKDKTISAFDPGNTLVVAPSLFSGTLVPAACRTEIVGIAAQTYPIEWFSRSNAGGRFANMLKWAGYDAIVLEGAADKPTWINIVEGEVEFKDAANIWGMDTWETQKVIFSEVTGTIGFGEDWKTVEGNWRTTQRPAVLCIGPAGENRSRIGTIQTDAGNAMGQGGYGGVWGSKNLKAISVWGTGSVEVADPKALMEARLWAKKNYGPHPDDPKTDPWLGFITSHFGGHLNPKWSLHDEQKRPTGCYGCHMNCRPRTSTGFGNESTCYEAGLFQGYDRAARGTVTEIAGKGVDLVQRLGINGAELSPLTPYCKTLYDEGFLGVGKQVNTSLRFDRMGELDFIEDYLRRIAYRHEIGDDLAEGRARCAKRWGRLEEDHKTGLVNDPLWGMGPHYDPRVEVYWGYTSLFSARDVNCHDINCTVHWMPHLDIPAGVTPVVSAKQVADWFGELAPYHDPDMADFSTANIYSASMAKTTAWVLHYTRFWKQACGLCDNAYADIVNPYGPNNRGLTPEGELKFYKAVTGESLSFEDSMEIGRKIFNLDKAIWTLQGRHRDMEVYPDFDYSVDYVNDYWLTGKEDGEWAYINVAPRHLDRDGVEELKTHFYELEGWDTSTGWQTRATLEELGLKYVADELESKGKLP